MDRVPRGVASRVPLPSRGDSEIDTIIAAMPPEMRRIARALRRAIRSVAPNLDECVKWNAPNWRGRKLVLCFMVYPDHLNLGLWRGAELAPSFAIVEGTGKSLRHVRMRSVAQAGSPEIRRLIRAAVTLDSA
jgi:hypothetical protein